MALSDALFQRLQEEGINSVDILGTLDDDDWNRLHKNVEVVEPGALRGAERIVRRLPAISVARLKVASQAVKYYESVGRPLEPENMLWEVLKRLKDEKASIKSQKDSNPTEVPKVSKSLPILRWLESFETFLGNYVGTRDIPLSYVIRSESVPANDAPPLKPGYPYSEEYGSVSEELVARATFEHPLFREDSKKVLQFLDEALNGTTYSHTISKSRRKNDGRGAFFAVSAQHGGLDKWKSTKDKAISDMRTSSWNGAGTITVSSFINKHRAAFDDLERCSVHLQAVEVPSERARVEYLLKGVAECNDIQFKSMIATIQSQEDDENGPYSSFEKTAALLLKVCPVAKKSNSKKVRFNTEGAAASAEVQSLASSIKKGPKTGVDIRYYKPEEYRNLTVEQKKELRECKRKNQGNNSDTQGDGKKESRNKRLKKLVVNAIKAQREAEEKERSTLMEAAALFSSTPAASANSSNENGIARVQALTKLVKDQIGKKN